MPSADLRDLSFCINDVLRPYLGPRTINAVRKTCKELRDVLLPVGHITLGMVGMRFRSKHHVFRFDQSTPIEIRPEPSNRYDAGALAVYVCSSADEREHVGYIRKVDQAKYHQWTCQYPYHSILADTYSQELAWLIFTEHMPTSPTLEKLNCKEYSGVIERDRMLSQAIHLYKNGDN